MKSLFYALVLSAFFATTAFAELRILTCEEPPTNFTQNGQTTGTTTDIVAEITKRLKIDAKIEMMPWARAYSIAKAKPNVVAFTCGRNQERIDHGFNFIGPVMTRKYVLWMKKGAGFKINSIEDIKNQNLKVGTVRGDWRAKHFKDLGFKVDEANSHELSLKKLMGGRFDLWILSDLEGPAVAKNAGIDINDIEIAHVFKEGASYIMLSKDMPAEMVDKWKTTYQEMQKTDFFEKGIAKWGPALGLEMGYAPESGYFIK